MVYKVYGDDELLYEQFMDVNSETIEVNVPMVGYDILKLVVDEYDDTLYDHACWIEPRFMTSTAPLSKIIEEANAKLAAAVPGILDGQTPQEAVDTFSAAIAAAQEVADKGEDASMEEIAAAAKDLRAAIIAFDASKVVVDKSELCGMIMLSKLLDESNYTAEKWAAFQEVYAEVLDVYNRTDVSQKDVDDAVAALGAAYKELNVVRGDVNGNGVLDEEDLAWIKEYIGGQREFTPEQVILADYDGNGKVNVLDLLKWKLELQNQQNAQ